MKLTCPKSGIRYECSAGYGSAKAIHPIFQVSLEKLVDQQLPSYLAGKLDLQDIHLFGSAMLAKLPIARWGCSLASPEICEQVWNQEIKGLSVTVCRIQGRNWEKLPWYTISHLTLDLKGLREYLRAVNEATDSLAYSPSEADRSRHINRVTEELFKILRDTEGKLRLRHKLPELIAYWAASAGKFSKESVSYNGKQIPLCDFWKSLIITAFSPDSVARLINQDVKIADYEELIEHCEQQIPYGSLHVDVLLERLRNAVEILTEFKPRLDPVVLNDLLEGTEIQVPSHIYMNGNQNQVLTAKIIPQASQISVPEPKRAQYKTSIEYLRARMKWAQEVIQVSSILGASK